MDGDLQAAHSSNLARKAFLADPERVQRRLEQVSDILNDRVDHAVCRVINETPGYLIRVLGPLPADGEPVGAWIDAATVVETYRHEYGITDKHHALGREPRNPSDRRARRKASADIQLLMAPTQVVEIDEGQRDVGPDLGNPTPRGRTGPGHQAS